MEFSTWLLARQSDVNASPHIASASSSDDFESWFLANGGYLHPSVELTSSPSHGNLLRVKLSYDLSPNDTVVSCPHTLTLSWPSAHKHHYPNVNTPPCPPHVATRFFLMKQKLLQGKSPWWPYIRMLLETFNTPMYYGLDDMKWIRGTNLERGRQVREDAWSEEYEAAMQTLFPKEQVPDLKKVWTWELYIWAATVMSSRSFPGPATFNQKTGEYPTDGDDPDSRAPVLIPGLDLLNHVPSSPVSWVWDSTSCSIKTDAALSGGDEVPNNYGPKSNEELIMGYGFTIPNNPADHFNIGFAPAIASYIKTTKSRRTPNHSSSSDPNPSFPTPQGSNSPTKNNDIKIHSVYLSSENYPIFTPHFLSDLSIAIENTRERNSADNSPSPPDKTTLVDFPMTRKQLHVLSALFMIMQRDHAAITNHNSDLPTKAQNIRQIDASRYRNSQLDILTGVLSNLHTTLSTLLTPTTSSTLPTYLILHLADTLTLYPKTLLKDYRSVLNTGLRTRDPSKIRERGGTDFAFTVWLCGLWVQYRKQRGQQECDAQGGVYEGSVISPLFSRWLGFLEEAYPFPCEATTTTTHPAPPIPNTNPPAPREYERESWLDPIRNPNPSHSETDTTILAAQEVSSYLDAIQASVAKHPRSLYDDVEISAERLMWCLGIVRQEGVWVPDLEDGGEGGGDDEWVLFVGDER